MLLLLLLSRFSRVQLCDSRDGSPPVSPVPGILQARTLEWVAIAFSENYHMTQQTPFLGIYPDEIKTEKDTCTPVFTAALFTIARTWKQLGCPLANEWIGCGTYTQWNITQL